MRSERERRRLVQVLVVLLAAPLAGCMSDSHHLVPEAPLASLATPTGVPSELNMVSLPPYVIGTPDLLLINVYTEPKEQGGPAVPISPQDISGQHLVRPDGTINLGVYGTLPVAGLTTDQVRDAVRRLAFDQLKKLETTFPAKTTSVGSPDKLLVAVDVMGYNSKAYYVITDGAGQGEQIYRFPFQGFETVLDALANVNGLPLVASKQHIWVARRTPHASEREQILPVDYVAITQHAVTPTNYQLLPGDRVYVRADKAYRVDGYLQKIFTPIERVLGLSLLGGSAYNTITNRRQNTNTGN